MVRKGRVLCVPRLVSVSMSPINRISQRAAAFTILGVEASATREDIRRAYRKLAFEKHPDRNPSADAEFARISAAYQFVSEHAEELGIRSEPEQPQQTAEPGARKVVSRPRPTVKSAETRFDEKTLKECEELLDTEGDPESKMHCAVAVYRTGRKLTYLVPSSLKPGSNEVAVPTGMLVDSRHVMPKIIAFDAREARNGLYEMDEAQCRAHFPGARSIQVRFAHS